MNPDDQPALDSNAASRRHARPLLAFALKAVVTISLVTWLVRSGSLEFKKLGIFFESPPVLGATIAAWLCLSVAVATFRWRILLEATGYPIGILRATGLQVMASFFNGLVPGNVGGDLIKNQAVLGNQPTRILVLVLVERTIGLISLIWAGAWGAILMFDRIMSEPRLLPVAATLAILIVGSVAGPWLLFVLMRKKSETSRESGSGESGLSEGLRAKWGRALSPAFDVLELIRGEKRIVAQAFLVSFLLHFGNIAYFLFLTRQLGNPGASFSEIAMVFPLGMLTLVLPISISGFGVGHVMFNELFELLNLTSGASIFNVFIVAQLAPCLFGAIPYLLMGSSAPTRRPDLPS